MYGIFTVHKKVTPSPSKNNLYLFLRKRKQILGIPFSFINIYKLKSKQYSLSTTILKQKKDWIPMMLNKLCKLCKCIIFLLSCFFSFSSASIWFSRLKTTSRSVLSTSATPLWEVTKYKCIPLLARYIQINTRGLPRNCTWPKFKGQNLRKKISMLLISIVGH